MTAKDSSNATMLYPLVTTHVAKVDSGALFGFSTSHLNVSCLSD
jgi:hypothetical protein